MAKASAYQCDGPDCDQLTSREHGHRYPKNWMRLTLDLPIGETHRGSLCSDACATAWVEDLASAARQSEMEG